MKQNLLLFVWELAVTVSAFGLGAFLLSLLKIRRQPLFVSGVLGVSAWIGVGGFLNAAHLIGRPAIFLLVGAGCALAVLTVLQRAASQAEWRELPAGPSATRVSWVVLAAAVFFLGTFVVEGTRQDLWDGDDLQGYMVMAVKALQLHAIQPDPFCERRVQAGVGGANFLDTFMLAGGDFRAMQFIDSGLGLALYGLAIWSLGRRLRVAPTAVAVALLCLPLLTLIKVNLTIVYLSVAGWLALVSLLLDEAAGAIAGRNRAIALGLLAGGLLTTKSTNIPFTVLLFVAWAALYRTFSRAAPVMRTLLVATASALVVAVPWSWQNKHTAGTYLYPLLGKGFHGTAYGLIPTPSQAGVPAQMIVIMLPALFSLGGILLCAWRLTRSWDAAPRSAVLASFTAALLAVPVVAYGLGGEAVDRYTAPFVMPPVLLGFLVLWRSVQDREAIPFRLAMAAILSFASAFGVLFLGVHMGWYRNERALLYDAFRYSPKSEQGYFLFHPVRPADFQRDFAHGSIVQRALPPGATAIEDVERSYPFDFRRNTIYVQDTPGMASPPPGFPLTDSSEEVRHLFLAHDIHYVIFDRALSCAGLPDWAEFLRDPRPHVPLGTMLRYFSLPHRMYPYTHVEGEIACHSRHLVEEVAHQGRTVYDDGKVFVARID